MTRTDTERVHHPLFARIYQRVSAAAEQLGAAEHRQRLLDGLTGSVVEVGAGNGLNFAHYPPTRLQAPRPRSLDSSEPVRDASVAAPNW